MGSIEKTEATGAQSSPDAEAHAWVRPLTALGAALMATGLFCVAVDPGWASWVPMIAAGAIGMVLSPIVRAEERRVSAEHGW